MASCCQVEEEEAIAWSAEQLRVIDLAMGGKNIFFTGPAGSGKSLVLKEISKQMKKRHAENEVAITSCTGSSAVSLKGTTVHSWSGIGLGTDTAEDICKKIRQTPVARRWQRCKVLIIDEVSMMNKDLFTKLEFIARSMRHIAAPFGSLQLILSGDFLQLGPVASTGFCFQSPAWSQCVQISTELTQIYRQSRDLEFQQVLQKLRYGECGDKEAQFLKTLEGQKIEEEAMKLGLTPALLFAFNLDVTQRNDRELEKLTTVPVIFEAVDEGNEPYLSSLKKNCTSPAKLILKEGAQVMLTKNLNVKDGLVNGRRGKVIGFDREEGNAPIVRFADGKERLIVDEEWTMSCGGVVVASRCQIPLQLSYALTIHKCQGMTLDYVKIDLSCCLGCGQAYTALSRAPSSSSISLVSFRRSCFVADKDAVVFHKSLPAPLQISNLSDISSPISRAQSNRLDPSEWVTCKKRKNADWNDENATNF